MTSRTDDEGIADTGDGDNAFKDEVGSAATLRAVTTSLIFSSSIEG
jgi:hypothetical protein